MSDSPKDYPGFFDQTTDYIKDPATGLWIVRNPAGSTAYNLLSARGGEDSVVIRPCDAGWIRSRRRNCDDRDE